jgi:hypothetical protein
MELANWVLRGGYQLTGLKGYQIITIRFKWHEFDNTKIGQVKSID